MAKNYGLNAEGTTADVARGDMAKFLPEDLLPMKNYRFGSFDTDPEVKAAREKEIEDMVASLLEEGQKQAIVIHEIPGKRFRVHAGDTRHQAFLRIRQRGIEWPWDKDKIARIECRVENFSKDAEKQVFGSSIVENLARNSLTPIDLCIAVAEAERLGYTDTEIMAKFRQHDPAWLPNMRRLARLPDAIKRKIHLKEMRPAVGYILAEIPEEYHAEVLAEASSELTPNGIQEVSIETPVAHPVILGDIESEAMPTVRQFQDNSGSFTPPPASGKPKPITARGVASAAKKRGLLKHKKIAHTVAGMREFWSPYAGRKDSLVGRMAQAHLAWLDTADDAKFWEALKSILKEVK